MARGITPRRPARTGRHEGIRGAAAGKQRARGDVLPKMSLAKARKTKTGRVGTGPRPIRVEPIAAVPKSSSPRAAKGYNPLALERVQEILQRLDQLYPTVTC